MHQLKSIYNSQFKDSHSHPIHPCFPIIASNVKHGSVQCFCSGSSISWMSSCRESEEAVVHDPEDVSAVPGCVGALLGCVGALLGCVGALLGCVGALLGCVGALPGFVGALLGYVGALPGFVGALPGHSESA